MKFFDLQRFSAAALLALGSLWLNAPAAQAQLTRGFEEIVESRASGSELVAQPDLWVLEVTLKPLRMITVEITDPKTKEKKPQLVWYLVYKVINRGLEQRGDQSDSTPVNVEDPQPVSLFIPELAMVADDNGVQRIYHDMIIPEAQAAIFRRERLPLQNSVEIMGPIPPASPKDAEKEDALYGVAMWTGIDPETDCFTVLMSGFSNGYKAVRGPVTFDKLRELAAAGELRETDTVWADLSNWRLENEDIHACDLASAAGFKQLSEEEWDKLSDWRLASEIGGLFSQANPPPPNAAEFSWYYSVTSDRFGKTIPPVWRRTLVQRYWRPGDRFDEKETEIRARRDLKRREPKWIYRPDGLPGVAPQAPAAPETEPEPATE